MCNKATVAQLIRAIGDDPDREGLRDTPRRVVKSWRELYGGYGRRPESVLKPVFHDRYDEMVLLKNVEFYSTCEHHMLPFYGRAAISYIPNGAVVGISKLARLLDIFARRLQIQERLTVQVANTIEAVLKPKGVGVIIEAQHFCITSRGIRKRDSLLVTSCLLGCFQNNLAAREEFIRMANGR